MLGAGLRPPGLILGKTSPSTRQSRETAAAGLEPLKGFALGVRIGLGLGLELALALVLIPRRVGMRRRERLELATQAPASCFLQLAAENRARPICAMLCQDTEAFCHFFLILTAPEKSRSHCFSILGKAFTDFIISKAILLRAPWLDAGTSGWFETLTREVPHYGRRKEAVWASGEFFVESDETTIEPPCNCPDARLRNTMKAIVADLVVPGMCMT